jgi:hypothetical protein
VCVRHQSQRLWNELSKGPFCLNVERGSEDLGIVIIVEEADRIGRQVPIGYPAAELVPGRRIVITREAQDSEVAGMVDDGLCNVAVDLPHKLRVVGWRKHQILIGGHKIEERIHAVTRGSVQRKLQYLCYTLTKLVSACSIPRARVAIRVVIRSSISLKLPNRINSLPSRNEIQSMYLGRRRWDQFADTNHQANLLLDLNSNYHLFAAVQDESQNMPIPRCSRPSTRINS